MGIMSKVVKDNTDINDELLFAQSLAGAKAEAKFYLTAALVCTTPELRSLFSTYLDQCMLSHSALVELGVKKGWIDITDMPEDVLLKELEKSNCLLKHDE